MEEMEETVKPNPRNLNANGYYNFCLTLKDLMGLMRHKLIFCCLLFMWLRNDGRNSSSTPRGSVGLVAQFTPQFPGWVPPGPLGPPPAPKMRPPQGHWMACYLWCPTVPGMPPPMLPPMLPPMGMPPPRKADGRRDSSISSEDCLFWVGIPPSFVFFLGFHLPY